MSLHAPDGRLVRLLPLALTTVIEDAVPLHHFQLVQTGAENLSLRLDTEEGPAKRAAWNVASRALHGYLGSQSLANVKIVLDRCRPEPDRRSGKLREVIVATTRDVAELSVHPAAGHDAHQRVGTRTCDYQVLRSESSIGGSSHEP